RQALARAGGRFPADLHFGRSRLSHAQREALFKDLAAGLTAWAGADHAAAGVALVHVGDVFASGPTLLTERAYDNRYIAMTWALIEHLVFVDGEVRKQLQPDASVHVHIANRAYVFDGRFTARDQLEALGWGVRDRRGRPGGAGI